MNHLITSSRFRQRCGAALLSLSAWLSAPAATAELTSTSVLQQTTLENRARISYGAYILGPGDGLEIELVDIPELSGRFTIGPDGTLYLLVYALYVEAQQ